MSFIDLNSPRVINRKEIQAGRKSPRSYGAGKKDREGGGSDGGVVRNRHVDPIVPVSKAQKEKPEKKPFSGNDWETTCPFSLGGNAPGILGGRRAPALGDMTLP